MYTESLFSIGKLSVLDLKIKQEPLDCISTIVAGQTMMDSFVEPIKPVWCCRFFFRTYSDIFLDSISATFKISITG